MEQSVEIQLTINNRLDPANIQFDQIKDARPDLKWNIFGFSENSRHSENATDTWRSIGMCHFEFPVS